MADAAIAIEQVLAAVIDAQGGLLRVPAAEIKKDRAGFAIAIDYDNETQTVLFTLIESENIEFDDNDV